MRMLTAVFKKGYVDGGSKNAYVDSNIKKRLK